MCALDKHVWLADILNSNIVRTTLLLQDCHRHCNIMRKNIYGLRDGFCYNFDNRKATFNIKNVCRFEGNIVLRKKCKVKFTWRHLESQHSKCNHTPVKRRCTLAMCTILITSSIVILFSGWDETQRQSKFDLLVSWIPTVSASMLNQWKCDQQENSAYSSLSDEITIDEFVQMRFWTC